MGGGGGYRNHFALCSSVHVSDRVRSVSPTAQPFFFFFFYQTWYGDALSWGDVSHGKIKNWFPVFSVKVSARVYIIKIRLLLLYLLNCWSVCNQTCCTRPQTLFDFLRWSSTVSACCNDCVCVCVCLCVCVLHVLQAWSPNCGLTWANGRRTMNCVDEGQLNTQDISTRMRHRALNGYGMQVDLCVLLLFLF